MTYARNRMRANIDDMKATGVTTVGTTDERERERERDEWRSRHRSDRYRTALEVLFRCADLDVIETAQRLRFERKLAECGHGTRHQAVTLGICR
jgi:hypothetical protein